MLIYGHLGELGLRIVGKRRKDILELLLECLNIGLGALTPRLCPERREGFVETTEEVDESQRSGPVVRERIGMVLLGRRQIDAGLECQWATVLQSVGPVKMICQLKVISDRQKAWITNRSATKRSQYKRLRRDASTLSLLSYCRYACSSFILAMCVKVVASRR